MDNVEDSARSRNELDDLREDLETLALGGLGTGAVRAESNPVGYQTTLSAPTPTNRRKKKILRIPGSRTSLLLLHGQLVPVRLHTVTQLHPQIGLLLGRHGFPALLDAGEGRVRDGMLGRGAGLLRGDGLLHRLRTGVQADHWAWDGAVGTNGSGGHGRAASSGPSDGLKEHCVCGKRERTESIGKNE